MGESKKAYGVIAKMLCLPADKPGYVVDAVRELWNEHCRRADEESRIKATPPDKTCSFCGKPRREVACLIEAQESPALICNECVATCVGLMSKHMHERASRPRVRVDVGDQSEALAKLRESLRPDGE